MNAKDAPCREVASTLPKVECLSKALASADLELNSVYAHVKQRLDTEDTQRLINAQRLWMQYRDANCAAASELYGVGTGGSPTRLACLEKDTRERIKELKVTYWK
jgi:uncharacterized protein YecT (DUF1311 family)